MVNGKMIRCKARGMKNGLMDLLSLETTFKARRKGKASTAGQTEQFTRESGMTTSLTEKELTIGQTVGLILETGRITKCMEKECTIGTMEDTMRVSINMTKNTDMESINGPMGKPTLEAGKRESNMGMGNSMIQRKMRPDLELGKMVNE